MFLIEYFGPIAISLLLVGFQKEIYGKVKEYSETQKLGLGMVLGHYIKRELETLFVHRFSNDTMPFMNVFKNSAHYWIIMGIGAMYFFLSPDYKEPEYGTKNLNLILAGAFTFCEFMNLMCHITLR